MFAERFDLDKHFSEWWEELGVAGRREVVLGTEDLAYETAEADIFAPHLALSVLLALDAEEWEYDQPGAPEEGQRWSDMLETTAIHALAGYLRERARAEALGHSTKDVQVKPGEIYSVEALTLAPLGPLLGNSVLRTLYSGTAEEIYEPIGTKVTYLNGRRWARVEE